MTPDSIRVRWEASVSYDWHTIPLEDLDCETHEEFEALDDETQRQRISAILDVYADLFPIPVLSSIQHRP